MNSIDLAILVLLFGSALIGLLRGFTREVLAMFTWLGSATAAYLTVPIFNKITSQYISNPMMADAVTGIILFLVFLIVFSIVSGFIANSVRNSTLGGVDRSLGFSFGLVRGIFVILLIEVGLTLFTPRQNQALVIQTARFTPLIRSGGDVLFTAIPASWKQMIAAQTTKNEVSKVAIEKGKDLLSSSGTGPTPAPQPQEQVPIQPQQSPTQPQPKEPQKPQEEDTEKTAESLANLKPQSVMTKNPD
jgi:membrane protein required for colicin V production